MWDLRVASPFGRTSIRNMLVFAAATLAASFAYILLTAPSAHAADADWNGDAITYQQNQYVKLDASQGPSDPPGTYYAYIEPSSASNPTAKAHLIYLAPDADPATATSASYVTYTFIPPNTYSNPTGKTSITLTPKSTSSSKGITSCVVEGLGWIICPITNFLSNAMDWLFGILSSFLTVRPAQTGTDNVLFRAWSYMRNFANVAFVIGFLIIIYSQLTNIGLSNYSVKKMLPRLIIAVILVNTSYWICAIAIDLSNIAGYSIQDIFISIRNNVVGTEGNSWDIVSWKSIGGFILSGGTAALGAGIGVHAILAGGAASALYLLLPILVGVLVAVLVALLVLASRQALITVLVILSPLAFVAYLLPNTEKYFKKWHEVGSTMLVMFPLFSIIFGGAQLAGTAIIQNADSINLVLLGMAVQVAPVAITPLIIRFSGSLLGKVAGLVNNPNKGLIDRTRNWSKERADQHKARVLSRPATRRRDFLARRTQSIDNNRRKREGWQKANEAMADARWENTHDSHAIHRASMQAGLLKERGESAAQAQFEASKHTNAAIQELDMNVRANKLKVDLSKATVEANWEEHKAGDMRNMIAPDNLSVSALANYTHARNAQAQAALADSVETGIQARRLSSAKEIQQKQFTDTLINSQAVREQAGGIAPGGADSALAAAVAQSRKEYNDKIQEKIQLMRHFNLSSAERQDLALGGDITAFSQDGHEYVFKASDDFAREAAIDDKLKTGSFSEIEAIIKESGKQVYDAKINANREGRTASYATSIAQAIAELKLQNKAIFFGQQTINEVAQGTLNGDAGLDNAAVRVLLAGKISDEALSSMNAAAIERMFKITDVGEASKTPIFAAASDAEKLAFNKNIETLKQSAWRVMDKDILRRNTDQASQAALSKYAVKPPDAP